MTVKVVIFDLDDTLTDNKMLDLESFRYLSYTLGLYVPSMRELKNLRRKSFLAKDIISWIIDKSKKSVPLDLCMKKRDEFLSQKENQRLIRIKPNARSILKKLKLQGYVLLIVTSRTQVDILITFLQSNNIAEFFINVYSSHSLDRTNIYKGILEDLKVTPAECLVVGNALQDLLPALGLGMKVVGIKGSYGIDPCLLKRVKVIDDLSELYTYVRECAR